MKVKLMFILSVLAIFLLSSCTYEQPAVSAPKVYIVSDAAAIEKESQKTFVVGEESLLELETDSKQKRNEFNKIRALRDFEDNQEEFDFESRYSNVRRIIDDELVRGYIPELDNPDFKEVD